MIAGIFPGQGNQKIGMGKDLYETYAKAREMYDSAARLSGKDIKTISFDGPEEAQRDTGNLQLITYVHSCVVHSLIREHYPNLQFGRFAGHSVGEYAALFAAGYISFEDGVLLVKKRSELMKKVYFEEPPLAVILGAEREAVQEFCDRTNGDLELALCNAPGNYVVGGLPEKIKEHLDKTPFKTRKLPVSGPFHTRHYREVAEEFKEFLNWYQFREPTGIAYANSTAEVHLKELLADSLSEQLYSTVLWEDIIRKMPCDMFIEMGPGKSLAGMNRAICPAITTVSVSDVKSLENLWAIMNSN